MLDYRRVAGLIDNPSPSFRKSQEGPYRSPALAPEAATRSRTKRLKKSQHRGGWRGPKNGMGMGFFLGCRTKNTVQICAEVVKWFFFCTPKGQFWDFPISRLGAGVDFRGEKTMQWSWGKLTNKHLLNKDHLRKDLSKARSWVTWDKKTLGALFQTMPSITLVMPVLQSWDSQFQITSNINF